jgi:acyl-CoA thioester hydrolase
MEHVCRTRVRYGETDQMGVVHHPEYLHYFEMGRTELMRASGAAYADLERRGILLVVTEASLRYRSAAVYDEQISILTRLVSAGKARLRFTYEVRGEDGRLCAEGHTELASLDRDKSPVRLPPEIQALLPKP